MNDIALAKEQLRQQILSERKVPYPDSVELITENLFQLLEAIKPKRVAIYQSYPSEPRTLDFIAACPVPVIVPVTEPDGTLSWQDLANRPVELQPGDLLVIPALAVDHAGNRLGRGKGYFDRELARVDESIPVYAVVFEREYLVSLPVEGHDRPVNGVVSEVRVCEIH
jgi:5-formyltetrahydrofolate cyclo-ligase